MPRRRRVARASASSSMSPLSPSMPCDIWIAIASKLTLRDRTSMMRACKAFERAVVAHTQSQCVAAHKSPPASRVGADAVFMFVDDDPCAPCLDARAIAALLRVILARARVANDEDDDHEARLVAYCASRAYDASDRFGASMHASARLAATILVDATRAWGVARRGRCIGAYLREDLDVIGDYAGADGVARTRAETNAWFAMHAMGQPASREEEYDDGDFREMVHLTRMYPDESRWVNFSKGFSAVLSTRASTHPALFAVLCGPCVASFLRRGIDDYDALFASDRGGNDYAREVESYRVFSHGGMALTDLEALRRIDLARMAEREDVVLFADCQPWDCFNFEICALAKVLDFTYVDSSLTDDEFAWLVHDCSNTWSKGFALALLAMLVDFRASHVYLISHFLFRNEWRLSTFSSNSDVDEAQKVGESILRGHDILRMLSRHGEMTLQLKTCKVVIHALGQTLTRKEREAISLAITSYCGDYMAYLTKVESAHNARQNIRWFYRRNRFDLFAAKDASQAGNESPMNRFRQTRKRRLAHVWNPHLTASVSSAKEIAVENANEE